MHYKGCTGQAAPGATVTPEQQIARLEMVLGRVRRNAAAPRRRPAVAPRSTAVEVTSSDVGPELEPVELSDDDVVAVVSQPPPAVVEDEVSGPTPPSDDRVEAAPFAGKQPSQTEDLELELEDVVSAPEPSPAQLQPSEPPAAIELPARQEVTPAAEPTDAAAKQEATEPERESRVIRTLRPEAPSVEAPLADESEATASLELIEEDDLLELESIPPSAAVAPEPIPAQSLDALPELELDEPGAAEPELDKPAVDKGPEVVPVPGPARAASPQPVEPAVATDQPVDVARRPAISTDAEPAIVSPAAPKREPQTFLQWLDASLKLG
jgi:hypothetical protein